MPTTLNYLPRLLVLKLIRIYQKTLSFDHGLVKIFFPNGYCKYRPTCSQYAYQSVEKYGIIKGGLIAAWRVLRCNPFSGGGHDPVK
ncbi:MAG: membrane protein insertion efficiency factor YidD [Candidatus Buchananbacteria bacterium RIFCSPHIGHO2_02_FULL_40_13]|nr:MAG: membrane protein insertion efficiency factor YidD [Candidatus Buchananbacteria bacterium RIFCSPHIGHO2_02_FULL_40_13]